MNHLQLAETFHDRRDRLRAVAFRMLGSTSEAEDALQEAWFRIQRADTEDVENLGGWFTTVVARICLDLLRARKSRREEPLPIAEEAGEGLAQELPKTTTELAEALAPALLVVLDRLAPAERVAFVLHDLFDVGFDAIAPILGRTPEAARKLASRARQRVRGGSTAVEDFEQHHEIVGAFLAASREGDFERLLSLLAPDAELRADALAVRSAAERAEKGTRPSASTRESAGSGVAQDGGPTSTGARPSASTHEPTGGPPRLRETIRGARQVAEVFRGRARGAVPVRIDGRPGAAWMMGGTVRAAFLFTIHAGAIAAIHLVMEPSSLAPLAIEAR